MEQIIGSPGGIRIPCVETERVININILYHINIEKISLVLQLLLCTHAYNTQYLLTELLMYLSVSIKEYIYSQKLDILAVFLMLSFYSKTLVKLNISAIETCQGLIAYMSMCKFKNA